MNPSAIINDDMTLEEKLEAIEREIAKAQAEADQKAEADGLPSAPIDPATLIFDCNHRKNSRFLY